MLHGEILSNRYLPRVIYVIRNYYNGGFTLWKLRYAVSRTNKIESWDHHLETELVSLACKYEKNVYINLCFTVSQLLLKMLTYENYFNILQSIFLV